MATRSRSAADAFTLLRNGTGLGILGLDQYRIQAESVLRVVISGAGAANVVSIEGKIGTAPFEPVTTFTGNDSDLVDIHTYDFVKFECTTYDGSPFVLNVAGYFPISPIATPGSLPVGISTEAKQDSMLIKLCDIDDTLKELESGDPATNTFDEVTSVATSTLTTVVSYTVPAGLGFLLQLVEASGTNIAEYRVLLDTTLIAKRRTYFGGAVNTDFKFDGFNNKGIVVAAATVITLKVIHERPDTGDFSGRILGVLED